MPSTVQVGTSALLRLAFDSSARLKTGFIFGSGGVFLTRRISLNIHPSILKLSDCTPLYPFDVCAKLYSSPPHSFIAIADRIRVRIPGCHISASRGQKTCAAILAHNSLAIIDRMILIFVTGRRQPPKTETVFAFVV